MERKWQEESYEIVDRCNTNDQHNVIPVNACVGSGKTRVASYALGKFIIENKDKKTFQMFVTPRIKLCKQQGESVDGDIKSLFGLIEGKDYKIVKRDCSIDESTRFNPKKMQYAKHIILVICDESLWGTDKKATDPDSRFHVWMSGFEKMVNDGYIFGNAIFDEAHNFTNNHNKIFGKED